MPETQDTVEYDESRLMHCEFADSFRNITLNIQTSATKSADYEFQVYNLKHTLNDALDFCLCKNRHLIPFDLSTPLSAEYLRQIGNELDNVPDDDKLPGCKRGCDMAMWLPYQNKATEKWMFSYFNEFAVEQESMSWSRCNDSARTSTGLDHTDQPFGEDSKCLAYHYMPEYNATEIEEAQCAWGLYDHRCYNDFENYYDYDYRLTICTDLPPTFFLPENCQPQKGYCRAQGTLKLHLSTCY